MPVALQGEGHVIGVQCVRRRDDGHRRAGRRRQRLRSATRARLPAAQSPHPFAGARIEDTGKRDTRIGLQRRARGSTGRSCRSRS